MISAFLSLYRPGFPSILVYMLQSTEYQPWSYFTWFWRTQNFSNVMKRRKLEQTRAARLLLMALRVGISLQIILGISMIYVAGTYRADWLAILGLATVLLYPILWAHLVILPLIFGRLFIVNPKNRALIDASKEIFAKHPGVIIAVAGSYGKTSMKELLATVLGEHKKIAVTPANKNVPISHAKFAVELDGDEDVIVIEYGESKPGDVLNFAKTTNPNIGIITGLAPAHLDQYPTLTDAGKDIFSLADYLHGEKVYVNGDSQSAKEFIKPSYHVYGSKGIDDWKVGKVSIGFDGTRFEFSKGRQVLQLHTQLIGRHHIGPISLVAMLALELGLTKKQVEAGVAKTLPFEHRMQPRNLHGAWIIDDTYNGNIDGMQAGLSLLSELPGRRKIYVTPGLVDQGVETKKVHEKLGRMIAEAKPDKVVLMQNSVTPHIRRGMQAGSFAGKLVIEDEPLNFYTNLEHVVASGDVILMQNDWTDNYA